MTEKLSRGFKPGVGHLYEKKLLTLFLLKGMNRIKKYEKFQLESNIKEAGKSDDIVFIYEQKCNGDLKKKSILLQAKHKENTEKPIEKDDLINEKNINTHKASFKLMKYFDSYKDIIKDGSILETIEKLVIFTNIDISNDIKIEFNDITNDLENDDLIKFDFEKAKYFKLKNNKNLNESYLNRNRILFELKKKIQKSDHQVNYFII